jgi:siroheme synthase-like protein
MGFYPVSINMAGRRCVVIGGGAVAERKIAGLLDARAAVTVVSPKITDNIASWWQQRSIDFIARRYQAGDLAGYQMAFAATNDAELNGAVYQDGKSLGAWVNSADDPEHCDFILPSVLQRGDLTVAVSTGGGSPALSRVIREELESYFTGEYETMAALAAEVRKELRQRSIMPSFENWRQALGDDLKQLVRRGDLAGAKRHLLKELGATV